MSTLPSSFSHRQVRLVRMHVAGATKPRTPEAPCSKGGSLRGQRCLKDKLTQTTPSCLMSVHFISCSQPDALQERSACSCRTYPQHVEDMKFPLFMLCASMPTHPCEVKQNSWKMPRSGLCIGALCLDSPIARWQRTVLITVLPETGLVHYFPILSPKKRSVPVLENINF